MGELHEEGILSHHTEEPTILSLHNEQIDALNKVNHLNISIFNLSRNAA